MSNSGSHNQVIPQFDFSEAQALTLEERITTAMNRAGELLKASGYQEITEAPCIPGPATAEELRAMETSLGPLPLEYHTFLQMHRYLLLDDGSEVGGVPHEGVHFAESPWLSEEHREGSSFIVFANYWRYADGDQLMMEKGKPDSEVLVYLHEYPAIEVFAPSFSLALWRLVHETE